METEKQAEFCFSCSDDSGIILLIFTPTQNITSGDESRNVWFSRAYFSLWLSWLFELEKEIRHTYSPSYIQVIKSKGINNAFPSKAFKRRCLLVKCRVRVGIRVRVEVRSIRDPPCCKCVWILSALRILQLKRFFHFPPVINCRANWVATDGRHLSSVFH